MNKVRLEMIDIDVLKKSIAFQMKIKYQDGKLF